MKKLLIYILLITPIICHSTGGTKGGLLPAPKIIKGKIKDGIYTSPKKEFQIAVPNWKNTSENKYKKLKEQFTGSSRNYSNMFQKHYWVTGGKLSFGPAEYNSNIFHIEYAEKTLFTSYDIELKTIKEKIFKKHTKKIKKIYHSKVELISEDVDLFKAKKSYSRIYRQYTPKRKRFFITTAESLRYHFVDLIDYGSFNVMYWVEVPVNLDNRVIIEEKLKRRDIQSYHDFVNSFSYLKKSKKDIRGKIKDGIYYSVNNEFSVKLPHLPSKSLQDKEEWDYTIIQEHEDKEIDYVIFGPAKNDFNSYHAVYLHFPFEKDKEKYIKWLFENKLPGRSVGLMQKHFEKFVYKGLNRYYAVYESENDFFVTCITDNGDSFFEIEVDISKNTKFPKVDLNQLINRDFEVFNEMLDSFTVLAE